MRLKGFIILLCIWLINGSSLEAKTLYWNKGRGYQPFQYSSPEGILINNPTDTLKYDYFKLTSSSEDFSLDFRAKNINGNPMKKSSYITRDHKKINVTNPHWGFFFVSSSDTIIFSVAGGEIATALEPTPALFISCYNLGDSTKEKITLTEEMNPYDGENLWQIKIKDGNLKMLMGNHHLNEIFETDCLSSVTGFGFFAGWGGNLLVSDVSVNYAEIQEENPPLAIPKDLEKYLNESDDPMEGYWIIFDRELEESLLKLGGIYTLLCLKDNDGYSFLYCEGASVNSQKWNTGDLKIKLSPTSFSDIYDVIWHDSMKQLLKKDIKAQKGEGDTLSIQFPYQSSKIRLRKIP